MRHYEVLGVDPSISAEGLRAAYLSAARHHHPDLAEPGPDRARAERRMQAINEAWAVLGDAARRRRYDEEWGVPGPDEVPHRAWIPFDDDDDDVDPRDLLDDTPYDTVGVSRRWQVLPPLLVLSAIGCLLVGSFTAIPGLAALGVVCGVMGVVGFLAVPFFTVLRSSRRSSAGRGGPP